MENTQRQNEKPEFAAHAGGERPSWCRWRRLRAVHPRAQENVSEHQSAPKGEDNQTAIELVEMKPNRPKATERRGPDEENGTAAVHGPHALRLVILVAVLMVLVNVPVNSYGVSLARIILEASSLIIRDGLVLKGSGPEIDMLENDQKCWIRDIDTLVADGHAWEDVRFVPCPCLRDLLTERSIPEDARPAPEP